MVRRFITDPRSGYAVPQLCREFIAESSNHLICRMQPLARTKVERLLGSSLHQHSPSPHLISSRAGERSFQQLTDQVSMFARSRRCCPTLPPSIGGMFKCRLTKCWHGRGAGSLTDVLIKRPANHQCGPWIPPSFCGGVNPTARMTFRSTYSQHKLRNTRSISLAGRLRREVKGYPRFRIGPEIRR